MNREQVEEIVKILETFGSPSVHIGSHSFKQKLMDSDFTKDQIILIISLAACIADRKRGWLNDSK